MKYKGDEQQKQQKEIEHGNSTQILKPLVGRGECTKTLVVVPFTSNINKNRKIVSNKFKKKLIINQNHYN